MIRELAERVASAAFDDQEIRDDWRVHAVCGGMSSEQFFAKSVHAQRIAKKICRHCPVKASCLADALSMPFNPPGVWGDTMKYERDRLIRMYA